MCSFWKVWAQRLGYSWVELRNKVRDGYSLILINRVTIFLCFAVCDSRASQDALFCNSQEYSANENKQDCDCVVLGMMGISVSGAIILFFFLLQQINTACLDNFLSSLEVGYSKFNNPYHNLIHGADVTHTTYYLLHQSTLTVSIISLTATNYEIFSIIAAIQDWKYQFANVCAKKLQTLCRNTTFKE